MASSFPRDTSRGRYFKPQSFMFYISYCFRKKLLSKNALNESTLHYAAFYQLESQIFHFFEELNLPVTEVIELNGPF